MSRWRVLALVLGLLAFGLAAIGSGDAGPGDLGSWLPQDWSLGVGRMTFFWLGVVLCLAAAWKRSRC
jgi:hypothetical protein